MLLDDEDTVLECRLRGNYRLRGSKQTNPIAVGDRVRLTPQPDGTGLITDIDDRRNYIVRRATKLSKQTHVIAANIDLLCVVATLAQPRTSLGFVDRLLATAEAYRIPACIVVNKADLLDAEAQDLLQHMRDIYAPAGYPLLLTSALRGDGIDELRRRVEGRTVLFSGHSGVGKSALLNALCPGLDLRVGSISDYTLKGRHTTTFAEIFPLRTPSDPASPITHHSSLITHHSSLITYYIDTPGIKEFGLVGVEPQELSHFFPEMRTHLHRCRFANCTHSHEPGCAVVQAVDKGLIALERYQSYLAILQSL